MRDSTASNPFTTFRAVAHSSNSVTPLIAFVYITHHKLHKSDARQHGKQ